MTAVMGPLRVDIRKLFDLYVAASDAKDEAQYKKLEVFTELLNEVAWHVPPYIDDRKVLQLALKEVRLMTKISVSNPNKEPGQDYGFCETHKSRYDRVSGCLKCKKI